MEIDTDRIDETVLALLDLTLHEERRAWKTSIGIPCTGFMPKGFISNPLGMAKSVVFTDKGLVESEPLFIERFVKLEA